MSTPPEDAVYSIAAVSKLTGASCHALRVWERRYGFPIPHRSASGHRRYSREQVEALRAITDLAQEGRSIGELIAEFRAGRIATESPRARPAESAVEGGRNALVDGLVGGDASGGEVAYRLLTRGLDPVEAVTRVIEPAWIEVGERWFRREISIFQERIVSDFLGRKLEVLIEEARLANREPARTILVGTVEGDRHEGGILMLNLFLERKGWRVFNLGVDLPVREYQSCVQRWRPDAMALSFVLSRNIKKRFQGLFQIKGLPIFVGGRSILNYQSLARRHGLIPLPGSIAVAVEQLQLEFDRWVKADGARSTPSP